VGNPCSCSLAFQEQGAACNMVQDQYSGLRAHLLCDLVKSLPLFELQFDHDESWTWSLLRILRQAVGTMMAIRGALAGVQAPGPQRLQVSFST
jgi:hypothetical protein